jgi:hypothetical protein
LTCLGEEHGFGLEKLAVLAETMLRNDFDWPRSDAAAMLCLN